MEQSGKKLFTAELQRMKARGIDLQGDAAFVQRPALADNRPILEAIGALRNDMRVLQGLIRGEDVADDGAELKRDEISMLKSEVCALSLRIEQTKVEIAALRPSDSATDRLIAVTNELDAIVSSTESATQGILENAEKIDNLANRLKTHAPEGVTSNIADEISEAVVSMFEHCNFQDITGQRITKVCKTLQYIEQRVNKMIEIWGRESFEGLPAPPEVEENEEKKLLNGPALKDQGISQADIDALFG